MDQPLVMSRKAVASLFGVTPAAISNWKRKGILRPVRLPGRKTVLGYRRSDILKLIESP